MKLTNSFVVFALILLSLPVLAANAPAPEWVTQRPDLPDAYWGIGQVTCSGSFPSSEEKQEAYQFAAAELSAMIGQRIVTSFSNTKTESGDGLDYEFKESTVATIQSMSEKRLSGIQIRDEWGDEASRRYHIWLYIGAEEANTQIEAWAKQEEDILREVLEEGVKGLETRIGDVEEKSELNEEKLSQMQTELANLLEKVAAQNEQIEVLTQDEGQNAGPTIRAHGFGKPGADQSPTLAQQSAIRAAQMDAKRNLTALVVTLEQESVAILDDGGLDSEIVIEKMRGRIKGARQIGDPIQHSDGTVEVVMEVEMENIFEN